jgi:hypothetical protein
MSTEALERLHRKLDIMRLDAKSRHDDRLRYDIDELIALANIIARSAVFREDD